ncbi:MAG TPA: hypothetical protein DEH22_07660, partial [Chloroflexi bacterium]|nr:hypothetical protein [Chloroflexota bacterium]
MCHHLRLFGLSLFLMLLISACTGDLSAPATALPSAPPTLTLTLAPPTATHLPDPPTETPAPTATNTPIPSVTPTPPITTILFTGAIVPGRCVQAAIDAQDNADFLYDDVRELISSADIAVGTLNAALTD